MDALKEASIKGRVISTEQLLKNIETWGK